MKLWEKAKTTFREIADISDHIDTKDASARIKSNIWYRGPNVWILAFSIIVASVGLNINSTAVIIGAMLISPLMGPIIGAGYALGTNDSYLLKLSGKNLLVMVAVSLLTSTLFFLLSPLNLVNPTELQARTSPTIDDVLVALFGGLAGILETCRKERGTVISGVAIATALMPPLCTAGYGLSNLDMRFFLGAMYLFTINSVFIALASYVTVKILPFRQAEYIDAATTKRKRRVISLIVLAVVIPSIWSAISLVDNNNFERKVIGFITENKTFSRSYIYDYKIADGKKVEVFLTGDPLDEVEKAQLLLSAERFGLDQDKIIINDHSSTPVNDEYERMVRSIYNRADEEMARKDARIQQLEDQILNMRAQDIPFGQLAREIRFRYPAVKDVTLTRGASVPADTLGAVPKFLVIARTGGRMNAKEIEEMNDWLKIRLNDTTVVVMPVN